MKILAKVIAIFLLSGFIFSCNDDIKPSQIPGIYKANFETKGVYIFVFKNGTCRFQDSLNQRSEIENATWKFKNGNLNIRKNDANGVWPAEIENENGVMRIVYADEEGDYYNKIKDFK